MIFRQYAVYPCHCFVAAHALVLKTDKTVFIIRFKIINIPRIKANDVVAAFYPNGSVAYAGAEIIVERVEKRVALKRL